jgi:curved DNA-binding protein CbpA
MGDKATAERRMREINQAYEILSDEQSRARYDSIRQNALLKDADAILLTDARRRGKRAARRTRNLIVMGRYR